MGAASGDVVPGRGAVAVTPELHIPGAALLILRACDGDRDFHQPSESCALAIARPVVVAELRRLCPGALVTRAQVEARIVDLEAM